jgi:hypothetical protein
MRHALLVVRAVGRQDVAHLVQRLAEAGDVAVPEDRPDAGEQGRFGATQRGALGGEMTDDGLGRGQAQGAHGPRSPTILFSWSEASGGTARC